MIMTGTATALAIAALAAMLTASGCSSRADAQAQARAEMHKHQVAACKNLAFGTSLADAGEFCDFTGITMLIDQQVKIRGWFTATFSRDAGLVVNYPDKLNNPPEGYVDALQRDCDSVLKGKPDVWPDKLVDYG